MISTMQIRLPAAFSKHWQTRMSWFQNRMSHLVCMVGRLYGLCDSVLLSCWTALNRQELALLLSGVIHVSYCHGVRPDWTRNAFKDNVGKLRPGQLAFNPTTYGEVRYCFAKAHSIVLSFWDYLIREVWAHMVCILTSTTTASQTCTLV